MATVATIFSVAGFKAGITYVLAHTFTGIALKYIGAQFLLSALSPKPKFSNSGRGYNVTATGSILDHQVIYGKMRVAGARIFDATTGGNNKDLHRVLAFAGHEIDSYYQIYLNDEIVTIDVDGNVTSPEKYRKKHTQWTRIGGSDEDGGYEEYVITYTSLVTIKEHTGTLDQVADASLVEAFASEETEWSNNHRLRGIAYLYCKFIYDVDAFPNGVPEVTAVIKGKKLDDPRSSAVAWSDNPALCIRDYICSSSYGLNDPESNIDDTAVTTAANICDEYVSSPVTSIFVGGEYKIKTVGDTDFTLIGSLNNTVGTIFTATALPTTSTGVVETKRFTTNGAFTTGITPGELLTNILTSMAGKLWFAQGKWKMKAAKFTNSVISLNENDLRSGINVSTRHSRRDNFNSIKGTFRGEESNWQVTDYPPVTNSAFPIADNNQPSVADVDLTFTDNSIEARRTARIMLETNRQQLIVFASFGMRALKVQVGDTISLTNERFGWSSKLFEVENWAFGLGDNLSFGVDLTLRETAATIYDEVDDGIVYENDNTNLLSPFDVPNVGVLLSTELRQMRGKLITVLLADISNASALVDQVEVQYKKSEDLNFSPMSVSSGDIGTLRSEAIGVTEGYYHVRARAINALGIRGDFTTIVGFFVDDLGTAPANVTNFSGNVVGSSLHLNWTPVSGIDVGHYNLRYSNQTTGAVYSFSEDLVRVDKGTSSVTVPAAPGTYFIKAVDTSSSVILVSASPASFTITDLGISALDAVATATENPTFSGLKSNVTIDADDNLILTQTGGNFETVGFYYFANPIDLGEKYTARILSDVSMTRFEQTNTFDNTSENFDRRGGLFDGDPDAFDDVSFQMQERHTDDDPSGSATYTNWLPYAVSDISARAFQFRIKLTSTNSQASPLISTLKAIVGMPDHTSSGNNITFTGSKSITFTKAFQNVPGVSLSIADLADGDRYTITSKTRTGFTINILTGNSASTNAVTVDFVAKGFGKEIN